MPRMYYVQATALTVAGTGDFLQLRNVANRFVKIHEIKVWQESLTAIELATVRIQRGGSGANGTALTERQMDITDAAPAATAHSSATSMTSVSSLDFDLHDGWNILQAYVWLPTPDIQLELAASDHLGLSLRTAPTSMTLGASVWWSETGV